MKEQEQPKHRDYLVTYNGYRCVGWKTRGELDELLKEGEVDWFKAKGGEPIHPKIKKDENNNSRD